MVIVDTADPAAASAGAAQLERYARADGAGGLALYAFGPAPEGIGNAVHAELLFSGGRTGEAGGEWLFRVGLRVPRDYRDEFLAWYQAEHLPILLECADWAGCRFVEARIPDALQFYALHQLRRAEALDSPERARSRATPWFARLARLDWFDQPFTRTLYRRVGTAG